MYTPPDGDDIEFDFTGGYSPPDGDDIEFDMGVTEGSSRRRYFIGAS